MDGGLNCSKEHAVYYYVECGDVMSLDVSIVDVKAFFDVLYNSIPPN